MSVRARLVPGAILLAILCGAALWTLGSRLSAPATRVIGAPPPSLPATPCSFDSRSGSTIACWFVPGSAGRGGILLAHSVRSNRLEMVDRARFLATAGYSILLFDAQAHGESPGERITFGHLEAHDARAAVTFAKARLPDEPIGYLGVSQGGAAALLGDPALDVDALVVEAVYPTLREAVVDRIAIRLGPLAPVLAPLLLLQVRARLGVSPDAVAPIEGIGRIRAPLLLVAGEADRRTRIEESRRLFDAAPEPKTLWVIPGAAHQNFHRFAGDEYQRRILDFFASTLGRSAHALE